MVADVTGDCLLDVLVRQAYPSYGFGVYPGLPGGGFGAYVGASVEQLVVDAAVGDSDGDGDLEVAVMNRALNDSQSDLLVRWWTWNGAGFDPSAAATIVGAYPAPLGVFVEAIDVTGGGIDDLVVGARYGSQLTVLLTAGGDPVLGPVLALDIEANSNGVRVAVGDADDDGDLDVLGHQDEALV